MFFNGYKFARACGSLDTVLVTLRIPYDDAHLALILESDCVRPSNLAVASRSRSIFVEDIEPIDVNNKRQGADYSKAFSLANSSFVYHKGKFVNLQQPGASAVDFVNGPVDSYVFFVLCKELALCMGGNKVYSTPTDQTPYRAILAKAHRTPLTPAYFSKYKRDRPVRERRPVKRIKL